MSKLARYQDYMKSLCNVCKDDDKKGECEQCLKDWEEEYGEFKR